MNPHGSAAAPPAATVLETPRLVLRRWDAAGRRDFRRLATDERVMRYIGTGETWDEERIETMLDAQVEFDARLGHCMWPVFDRRGGEMIGICGLKPLVVFDDIEIGWWLLPDWWGRGLATEMARAVLSMGFEQFRLPRIVAIARPGNAASIRIMEKLDMTWLQNFDFRGAPAVMYGVVRPD